MLEEGAGSSMRGECLQEVVCFFFLGSLPSGQRVTSVRSSIDNLSSYLSESGIAVARQRVRFASVISISVAHYDE